MEQLKLFTFGAKMTLLSIIWRQNGTFVYHLVLFWNFLQNCDMACCKISEKHVFDERLVKWFLKKIKMKQLKLFSFKFVATRPSFLNSFSHFILNFF